MKSISVSGRHGTLLTALLASTALAGIHPAAAQDTSAAGTTIETVVVTAEKHAESLQKVPFAIQAIGNEKIDQLNISSFNDYVKYLPSVNYTVGQPAGGGNGGPGFATVTMRGVTSGGDGNHSGSLPTVGIYLDEQPITTIGGALDMHLYDVQRVEALEGPQGTLYGASSEAGTIRIITNKPDPSAFSAAYEVDGTAIDGGGLGGTVEGYVNLPIAENAAIRIVAWDEHDGGYIDNVKGTRTYPTSGVTINNFATAKNDYNFTDTIGGRAALGIDLDNDWTITPSIVAQHENTNGSFGYDPSVGLLKVTHFYPEYAHDNWYQAALTIQGKIWNLDLTYSGGHMDRWINAASDYTDYSYWYDVKYGYGAYWTDNAGNPTDPSQYIIEKDHFTKDSHEIRIATPVDEPLRFVGGLFYERQGHKIVQNYKINALGSDFWVSPAWPQTIWLTDQERVDRDFAVFGELAYDITPQLTVTGGARVFNADNSLNGFFGFGDGYSSHTGVSQCFSTASFNNAPCTNLDKSVQEWGYTHKLSLKYQIDDDRMVYATWSTGFRPGGINRRGTIPPYSPDKLTNYEIGWKTAWYNGQLIFNGDVFWEDWDKFQFSFLGLNSFTEIHNGPNATIRGTEEQLDWLVSDHFNLNGSFAYIDAHTDGPFCGPVGVTVCPGPADPFGPDAPTGTRLPGTPKYKTNITGRYTFNWLDFLWHAQATWAYQSSSTPDLRAQALSPVTGLPVPIASALGIQAGFSEVNVAAGIENEAWALEFSVQNLLDVHADLYNYAECTTQVCESEPYIYTNRPRMFELKFSQKFD